MSELHPQACTPVHTYTRTPPDPGIHTDAITHTNLMYYVRISGFTVHMHLHCYFCFHVYGLLLSGKSTIQICANSLFNDDLAQHMYSLPPPPPPPFQTAPQPLFCIIPFQPISHCAVQCADYFCPHPAEADSDVSHPIHQFGPCPLTKRLQESGALPQGPEPAQTRHVGYQPAAIIHTIGTVRTKWGKKS